MKQVIDFFAKLFNAADWPAKWHSLPALFFRKSPESLKQAIQQRKQAEERLKTLLEAMPDALVIADKSGIITLVNHQAEMLFGYTKTELTGKPIGILMSEASKKATAQSRQDFSSIPEDIAFEKKFSLLAVGQNGHEFPAEIHVSRIHLEDGFYLCATIRDASERQKQEKERNEMAIIIASSSDAIISNHLDGTILTWNQGAEKTLGYTSAEMKGRHISEIFPPELLQEENMLLQKVLDGEKVEHYETIRVTKNQSRINVSITISAIKNEVGKVMAISNILRDVTQQKKAELELAQSNQRNKIFIQQSPHAIAMFDNQMRYLAASQRWVSDYGLEGQEILNQSHYDIFPEIGEDWKAIHRACLQGAVNHCDEACFERADGSVQWLTWDVRPWYISENYIGGLIMYTADITRLKIKEIETRRIETILATTNEVARIGTWEVDLIRKKIIWSKVTREIHEVPEDYPIELDKAINFFKEGDSRDRISKAFNEAIENGTLYDLELELTTGKNRNIWVRSIGQVEFKNGVCQKVFGVFQDIDEIKRSRVALSKTNGELNSLLNAGHVSIISTDLNGLITHFSKGAELLLQYSAEEMIGKQTPGIIHAEEEMVERGLELSFLLNKKITGFDVFTSILKEVDFDSREWTYVRKDGSTFPVQLVISAIKDQQGSVIGFLGIATDISVIKKAETEMTSLLQLTIDQKDRLKNFSFIVSHNLRSHAGNIEMILNLYLQTEPAAKNNKLMVMLQKAADNLKETIANLNEVVVMNTASTTALTPINLHQAINNAITNIGQMATQAAVTVQNNTRKNDVVLGLPAYIDSILLNFITNGVKYRAPGRDSHVVLTASVQEQFLILTIEDNGLGIDLKRNGAKLFGMYKTFHGNKDARGIGLFITKNQVEALGGKIEVESEVDKGTKFNIWFQLHKN